MSSLWNSLRGDPYELDVVGRRLDADVALTCPTADLVVYRGERVRYAAPVRVHRAFVPRLREFENVLVELAITRYGRAPRRIIHSGAYACRPVRGRDVRISEHALGNAIDIRAIEFGPLPRNATAPADMPRAARRTFRLDVARHWTPRREADAYAADTWHALADTLAERTDIFRGIVGPPHRRHENHLHFDAAPWHYTWYAHDG